MQALNGKAVFGKEYAHSIQQNKHVIQNKAEEGVGPEDEPEKWLVDTGASNYYSPFYHLFVHLEKCNPPVDILTGNVWIQAFYYGNIPLIIRVNGEIYHIHLKNVLYVPTLQTRVNLFSVVVLADRDYYTCFGLYDVKFTLDRSTLAQGVKIGTSWWLDCDVRSHSICMAALDDGDSCPESLEVWH